jgi:hypothetical protein
VRGTRALDEVILDYLGKAEHEILLDAYAVTDIKIAKELARQQYIKKNSLRVYAILEEKPSVRNYSVPSFLINSNVLLFYSTGGTNDSNYLIIDGKYLLTGAFDYTQAHSMTAISNLCLITDPKQVAAYRTHFINHLAVAALPKELVDQRDDIRKELQDWFLPKHAPTAVLPAVTPIPTPKAAPTDNLDSK